MPFVTCASLHPPPIIIVDSYDEVSSRQAEVISLRLLEPFLSRSCILMIIATRAGFAIRGDKIRRNEQFLFLDAIDSFGLASAKEQFERLAIKSNLPINNIAKWM